MPVDEHEIRSRAVQAVKLIHVASLRTRADAFAGLPEHHAGAILLFPGRATEPSSGTKLVPVTEPTHVAFPN